MLCKGKYKVIIIGAGPSGVTSYLYLKRANIDVLVINSSNSSLQNTTIENYYGFKSVSGKELFNNGLNQIDKDDLLNEEVSDISLYPKRVVKTNSCEIEFDYLVLATGKGKSIDSRFTKLLGCGVSVCAHCDLPMLRGVKVYYTGIDTDKLKEEISLYTNDFEYVPYEDIVDLKEKDGYLDGIILKNKEIKTSNLFVSEKMGAEVLKWTLGILSKDNKVIVNENYETNISGVYAIGDLSTSINQVISASYSGMVSSLDIIKRVKNE